MNDQNVEKKDHECLNNCVNDIKHIIYNYCCRSCKRRIHRKQQLDYECNQCSWIDANKILEKYPKIKKNIIDNINIFKSRLNRETTFYLLKYGKIIYANDRKRIIYRPYIHYENEKFKIGCVLEENKNRDDKYYPYNALDKAESRILNDDMIIAKNNILYVLFIWTIDIINFYHHHNYIIIFRKL